MEDDDEMDQNVDNRNKKVTPKFQNNFAKNSRGYSAGNIKKISNSSNRNIKITKPNTSLINNPTLNAIKSISSNQTATLNSTKQHHTALTYSTIKKIKIKAQPISKKYNLFLEKSVFQDKVLSQKKYNGKSDRVALYQLMKNEWNKVTVLNKPNSSYIKNHMNSNMFAETSQLSETEKQALRLKQLEQQKMRNIRRPVNHYQKFI